MWVKKVFNLKESSQAVWINFTKQYHLEIFQESSCLEGMNLKILLYFSKCDSETRETTALKGELRSK